MDQDGQQDNIPPEDGSPRRGAGILVLARDTGRFLALKRSDHVQHGRTWGLAGGLLDPGETPEHGAAREFREETEYKGEDFDLVPLVSFKSDALDYHNFIAVVEHEFTPSIDHENEAFAWVDSLDDWPAPVHFGIEFLKGDAGSMAVIRAEQAACDQGLLAEARAAHRYAPTLYHVSHGSENAPELKPDEKRGEIRATPNLREALPCLIPSRDRFATLPLPGTEDFIVIVPDRENFLKSGKLDGVIFQLPGDGFRPDPKSGAAAARWVKPDPVPLSERNYFDHVAKMDAAMYYGLHILFTKEPLTAENRPAFEKILQAPDFPANLKSLVRDGTLIYENARRGIQVSPFLQPEDAPPVPKPPNPRSLIHFGKPH